jgi:MarR family transcriptional regulator, transcriptional regulator for hemolysin
VIEDEWESLATPGRYFERIARRMNRVADARLRKLGFVSAQLTVLTALRNSVPLSQTDLARIGKVEQPTMAQLLARMERDGLILRMPDPDDGRKSLISLPKHVLAKLPEISAILAQTNREATAGLSGPEREMLVSLLSRVLANVDAMDR